MYEITPEILKLVINNNSLDAALDNAAEEKASEDETRLITCYAIQMLYRNGIRQFTEEEVCEKVENLILDRIAFNLEKNGFLESSIDENGEARYFLTEKGNDYVNNIQKG